MKKRDFAAALDTLNKALDKDRYLAVAYFQRAVSIGVIVAALGVVDACVKLSFAYSLSA